ncbi:MAG: CehA/McbA family metallohydrolase [Dehalococcoidia bacterium]
MLVDLHCHTRPLSQCSALSPLQAAELARARGLGAICLTEHDRWWDEAELAGVSAQAHIPIFAAVELTTDLGHVLAFGLPRPSAPLATVEAAFAASEAAGGVLFLAHPARDGLLKVDHRTVEYFASVEALNGSDSRLQNIAASGLAHGFRLPGIGGSDAHMPAEVGRAATRFASAITDTAALVAALKAGNYRAEYID